MLDMIAHWLTVVNLCSNLGNELHMTMALGVRRELC